MEQFILTREEVETIVKALNDFEDISSLIEDEEKIRDKLVAGLG